MTLETTIAVARGEEPADLVLRNARLLNVFSGEIHPADIAIHDGWVVGLGAYQARQVVDLEQRFVAPGLIETRMLKESDARDKIIDLAMDEIVLKRLGSPEDVAHVVVFLASEKARHITGEIIKVDGGQYI